MQKLVKAHDKIVRQRGGMEKDDEIKGSGNSYDFGARIYDPRIARWLSLDPMVYIYPFIAPYNFCLNSPIFFTDPDGESVYAYYYGENGINVKAIIQVVATRNGFARFNYLSNESPDILTINFTTNNPLLNQEYFF